MRKRAVTTTRHTLSHCPQCNKQLDASTSFHGNTPRAGDFTLCIMCNTVLVYRSDLTVRRASKEEINTMSPELAAYMRKLRWAISVTGEVN